MNVPIIGRWSRPSPWVRAGVVSVLATAGIGGARADPPRASVHAVTSTIPKVVVQSGDRFELRGRLAPLRKSLSGAGYRISASVSASPLACAGDTIFVDGFDP